MLVVGSRGTKTIIWEHNTARMLQVALSDPRYILPKAQKAADGKAEGDAAEGSAPKEAWPGLRMAAQTTEVVGAKKGMTCLFDILLVGGNHLISPSFGRCIWALVSEPWGWTLEGHIQKAVDEGELHVQGSNLA